MKKIMPIKPLADLCRTFNKQRYPAYSNWLTPSDIGKLRAAGVRCRRWRDVIYVHEDDHTIADLVLSPVYAA